MKNFIALGILSLLTSTITVSAQNIHLSADSVTKLLCTEWQVNYVQTQGKVIAMPPGTPTVYFEFFKDGTISVTGSKPKMSLKGTWKYDEKKGMIIISTPGKDSKTIISLTKDQFIVFADDPVPVPNDSLRVKIYFKGKNE